MKILFREKTKRVAENLRGKFSFLRNRSRSFLFGCGFTLIELVVVIGIMALVTSITLFNHARFNSNVTLENLAYEVALMIRQAQFFGVNVRGLDSDFSLPYGVYFDLNSPDSFVFFADRDGNSFYNSGEEVEIYSITRNNRINSLCAGSDCSVTKLNILFKRPDPDAIIKTIPNICGGGCGDARVYVASSNNNLNDKIITVRVTGQISISSNN